MRKSCLSDNAGVEIVSGYSRLSEPGRGEKSPVKHKRHLVVILYADIVDHDRSARGNEVAARLRMDEGKAIFKACIANSRGKLAHSTDDAILAVFKDADSALSCAVVVQLAMRNWNANLNPEEQVRYRVGISACEVIADQPAACGKAIDFSALLGELAHTSGICVSQSVREQIGEKSSFRFVSMGKRYLDNISEPVETFWIELLDPEAINFRLPGSVGNSRAAR